MLNWISNQQPRLFVFRFASSLPVNFHVAWRSQAIIYVSADLLSINSIEINQIWTACWTLYFQLISRFFRPYFVSIVEALDQLYTTIFFYFLNLRSDGLGPCWLGAGADVLIID